VSSGHSSPPSSQRWNSCSIRRDGASHSGHLSPLSSHSPNRLLRGAVPGRSAGHSSKDRSRRTTDACAITRPVDGLGSGSFSLLVTQTQNPIGGTRTGASCTARTSPDKIDPRNPRGRAFSSCSRSRISSRSPLRSQRKNRRLGAPARGPSCAGSGSRSDATSHRRKTTSLRNNPTTAWNVSPMSVP